MYRFILLGLYISVTYAAPQNSAQSDPNTEKMTELETSSTESIQNVTVSPTEEPQNPPDRLNHQHNYADRVPSEIKLDNKTNNDVTEITPVDIDEIINYVSSESSDSAINGEDKSIADEGLNDILTSENTQSSRQAKSYGIDDITTESDDPVTDNVLENPTKKPKSLANPKYLELPSHSSFTNNLITGRRKFKSKCRCEKIWRCAKLQITVPRCPDEYFMCCS